MMPFPITDPWLAHLQTSNLAQATVHFKLHVVVQYLLGGKKNVFFCYIFVLDAEGGGDKIIFLKKTQKEKKPKEYRWEYLQELFV